MSKNVFLSVLSLFLLNGCLSNNVGSRVPDATAKPILAEFFTCSKPISLTQDCSKWSGPKRVVVIDGHKFKVSGTADGTGNILYSHSVSSSTVNVNKAYELTKREFSKRGYEIISVAPINDGFAVRGYAVYTAQPSYQMWEEFLQKK